MRRTALLATLSFASLSLASCDASVTELVVVVDTDFTVPSALDGVRVEAPGMQSASGAVDGEGDLPRTVGIAWRGGSLGPITIRVVGTRAGAEVVERTVVTSFVEGRSLVVPVFLARACQGRTCAATQTCVRGACASAAVDPASLAELGGPNPGRFDAGPGCEPNSERCNGVDDDCDGAIDEGFDLASDLLNCGACGNACAARNASWTCLDGACAITECADGFGDCDATATNGCEADLSGVSHCGACGARCSPSNGEGGCVGGACTLTSCDTGFGDCNGDPSDGCEAALDTPERCGSCGACALANATSSCDDGACAVDACDDGFDDCNGDPDDGCEASLSSLAHCGGCGDACVVDDGTAACVDGECEVAGCGAMFADCNDDPDDGCETSLTTLDDCGACGVDCDPDDATGTCATGTCEIATCDSGHDDCNTDPTDGCEVNLRNDEMNCGECGTECVAPTDSCLFFMCR